MPAVRRAHINLLKPYLVGEKPRPDGEWDMFCPLHADTNRSAQMNVETGVWFCHRCEIGGRVTQLIRKQSEWISRDAAKQNGHAAPSNGAANGGEDESPPTAEHVRSYMASLRASDGRMEEIMSLRGLTAETLNDFQIGWDPARGVFTIPVYDEEDNLLNIRRYNTNPPEGKRKMWGMRGWNGAHLFPIHVLMEELDLIIVCGGEWDAMATIQHGFPTVTRTAAEKVWDAGWAEWFEGLDVYMCHDCDSTGQAANEKVGRLLLPVAKSVKTIRLPYPIVEKHGRDLTDYWLDGYSVSDFRERIANATPLGEDEPAETLDPKDASVLDTFDARRVGEPLRVTVTIKGKKEPGYSIPHRVGLSCSRDAGPKCAGCPLNAAQGQDEMEVRSHDPVVLELMESTRAQVAKILASRYGVPGGQCVKLQMEIPEHMAVEVLYARPSVDHVSGRSDEYKNMKITSVGRHNTSPNNTFQIVGALWPDPRTQTNEFLASQVNPIRTSLDGFELTDEAVRLMRSFRPRKGQKPLSRLEQIADDLARHATRIYGRNEMHIAMDLVFHSALAFEFLGQRVERGWIELLVVGDTRTGKSEAATGLVAHHRAGEVVTCESASFAGIVGGLQQYGSGKEWAITWGAVPINDGRLVVLDEISGLSHENIAAMSDIRSRGLAQLTKIQTEATPARTRLIWTGNPRDGSMADYTYGVQAIKPLIGNPEDVARFDLALSAKMGEVPPEEINRVYEDTPQKFDSEACSTLVRWVWSRTADQITWGEGAEAAVLEAAGELGSMYVEDPPLIQVANVRIKIARVAVAIACRLFSTDETYENVVVKRTHVRAAVDFIHRCYSSTGFGYYEISQEAIGDRQEAQVKQKEISQYLRGRPGLPKFLRATPSFRSRDLEETLNYDRETANAVINTLWGARMVRRDRGNVRAEPALLELLREVGRQ